MTSRGERVFVDVANKKEAKTLPPVALRLSEGAPPKDSQKNLEQRLLDAEIRRDIEIEAIKFKAALSSQPKKSIVNDENASASHLSAQINTKIAAATSRREEVLATKAAKGAYLAQRRAATEPPAHPKYKLEAKLENATARKAERLYERVEAAAALGTERVLGAAINRLKADAANDSARSDLKLTLELAVMETTRRKEAMLHEIAAKASRSGGSKKIAYVFERLDSKKRQRELALSSKLQKAARLKQARDQRAINKAIATSTVKLHNAKKNRLNKEKFRRLRLRDSLDARRDMALQRRELETRDKVIRAASLGSAAVATASTKRDLRVAADRAEKENRLDHKLYACSLRRGALVKRVIDKAAKRSALVAAAAEARKIAAEHQLNLTEERVSAAKQRRVESLESKVAGASQLGSQRVKTVLERKQQREEKAHKALREAIEHKQRAAATRYNKHLEVTRRGLNGKRNPQSHIPLRPMFTDTRKKASQNACDSGYGIGSAFMAMFMAVVGSCAARSDDNS